MATSSLSACSVAVSAVDGSGFCHVSRRQKAQNKQTVAEEVLWMPDICATINQQE
jgi:hypothetical protein